MLHSTIHRLWFPSALHENKSKREGNVKKFFFSSKKCGELGVGQTECYVRAILPSLFQPALQETQELIQVQSHVCRPPEVALYLPGKPQTLMEDGERILEIG